MPLRWVVQLVLAIALGWALASGTLARAVLAAEMLDELRRPGPTSLLRSASAPPRVSTLALDTPGGNPRRIAADLYRPA